MRICLAQINPTIGDLSGNTDKIISSIHKAKQQHADIVLFPELAICGYPPNDLLLLPHFIKAHQQYLEKIIASSQGIVTIVGLPRLSDLYSEKNLYNSAAIIDDGELVGYQDKMLLPTYDVFSERRYFEPTLTVGIWHIKGQKVAVTICEDIWKHSNLLDYTDYQRDPILALINQKPDLLLNLSASPYHVDKFYLRQKACEKVASTLQCPVLLCNQVGGNDGLIFDGYSLYVGKDNDLLGYAKGFEEDLYLVDTSERKDPVTFTSQSIQTLYQALVLGIRDYFHKSGFKKACLGLSGGIDSALTACLAVDALGFENVFGILMPSRYSSEGSIVDAKKLAEALCIKYKEIPIEGPFSSYLDLLGPVFEGCQQDVTEENLQARIRGAILMAFSNKFGYIVLSTGNKSELAMGYATLYGDMCGGLAVLSDITKRQVYELSQWINKEKEIIPIDTITKAPSAELRPNQKDSDSLPDYDIIDNVVVAYVEQHLSPEEIAIHYSYPLDLVNDLVKRIHRNEYKRRQSAPGLRVSNKAFFVGRLFPIVQRWM